MRIDDITLLEDYIAQYPWFSTGYLELYRSMCSVDKEMSESFLGKAASYVWSRERLYRIYMKRDEPHNTCEVEEIKDAPFVIPAQDAGFILAGGDYYSSKDFERIELDTSKPLDSFIAEKPSLLRTAISGRTPKTIPEEEIIIDDSFEDATFFTETLASIYAEQGHYKRALDIYAKLILLFPEKSAYFATLVKDIRSKM